MNQLNEMLEEMLQTIATIESAIMLMKKLQHLGCADGYTSYLAHMAYDGIDEYESYYLQYKEIADLRQMVPLANLAPLYRIKLQEYIRKSGIEIEEEADDEI